jgi:hypothetical protein
VDHDAEVIGKEAALALNDPICACALYYARAGHLRRGSEEGGSHRLSAASAAVTYLPLMVELDE